MYCKISCNHSSFTELAAEIKDFYPEKDVTLIHSRDRYLQVYKSSLHTLTFGLLKNKLGVNQILGDRVVVPKGGFSLEVKPLTVQTTKGRIIETDLPVRTVCVITCVYDNQLILFGLPLR